MPLHHAVADEAGEQQAKMNGICAPSAASTAYIQKQRSDFRSTYCSQEQGRSICIRHSTVSYTQTGPQAFLTLHCIGEEHPTTKYTKPSNQASHRRYQHHDESLTSRLALQPNSGFRACWPHGASSSLACLPLRCVSSCTIVAPWPPHYTAGLAHASTDMIINLRKYTYIYICIYGFYI